MLAFCGQERVLIDANGRIKLAPRLIDDFLAQSRDGETVLFCLPEGALALYPAATYQEMRRRDDTAVREVGGSILKRRELRRFGALSAPVLITRQGRITLPVEFREPADLPPKGEAVLVGVEIGIEIWSVARWQAELRLIHAHANARGEQEMRSDLTVQTHEEV